jgi:hypothetical protein
VSMLERPVVRALLGLVSLLAALSVGGGFVAGLLLVPPLVGAARWSSTLAAALHVTLAVILAAEVGWAFAYLAVGERSPAIWLVPAAVGSGVVVAAVRVRRPGEGRP